MRLFVTGTDTDVGKTWVTACLARAAKLRGSVVACKPVASGVPTGSVPEDARHIAQAAGHAPLFFASFAAPLSPHRAAALEGRTLPPDLLDRVAGLTANTVLVEGVGGWAVPLGLDPPVWVADLARATGPDVLVVAADRLGVLSHTLLTLRAIRADGATPVAVAVNRLPGTDDPSHRSNVEDLRSLLSIPVVALPVMDPRDEAAQVRIGAELWRAILPPIASR